MIYYDNIYGKFYLLIQKFTLVLPTVERVPVLKSVAHFSNTTTAIIDKDIENDIDKDIIDNDIDKDIDKDIDNFDSEYFEPELLKCHGHRSYMSRFLIRFRVELKCRI